MYCTIDKTTACHTQLSADMNDYPDGIVIPVDKPYGWTSADVIRKVKFKAQRHFKNRKIKVGHAGTLDPLATGVLLVCIGKATKQAEALQSEKKEYVANVRFGATTPCFDLEKEIDFTYPCEHITRQAILDILPRFLGTQQQMPPLFSAKLINGTRAYEYARAGEEKELKPATITIYDLELTGYDEESHIAEIRIECSKGTYIRSFARDLGTALQSGAHLTGLRRTRSGGFLAENCMKTEDIDELMKHF